MSRQPGTSKDIAPSGTAAAMVRIFGAAAVALVLLLGAAPAARAQIACSARDHVVEQLETRHGESRTAIALTDQGGLLEVYARPDGATWTVVVTLVDGRSCIVLTGKDWNEARQVARGPGV